MAQYKLTQTGSEIQSILNNANVGQIPYLTSADDITGPNTSGFLKIVVLPEEPAERYTGYLYIITAEAQ